MDSVEFGVKLGEKRPAEDGIGGRDVPAAKKARKEGDLIGSMRKVAEMVLVLSAIGKVRGGKVPSEVEKEIMAAAREKLAEVCELFPPKDVFPMDVFGRLIDDLGLNKVREQRLGFRPPKITIAEKLLLSKRKMEKAENFTLPSAQHSLQRLHTNSGVALENRAPPQAGRGFATDKPSNTPVSSGSFQSSPLGHVAGTNVTSLPYQLPTSEVRPMAPSGLPSSHLARDATPLALTRIDRPHFRLDGTNGSLHTPQAQANSSGNHNSVKMPPWSVQPQSASSPKIGAEKVPGQTTVKVERATDAKSGIAPQNATSKPFISQITSGNQAVSANQHLHGVNTTPAPIPRNYHTEIGKIVQKLLQPPVSERPAWTLPSRNYMNKALTCQTCKSTINDVDTVLVCDACEKGYHLKCLHINNPIGIPKAEWHCAKCLQLSNGKPLPPKYGRVMRNVSFPKMSAGAVAPASTPDKRAGALDEKVNQQKILANGNAAIQRSPTGNTVSHHSNPTSTSKVVNASQMQGNAIVVEGEMDDKSSSQIYLNNLAKSSCPTTISPNSSSIKRPCEEKLLQLKPHPPKSEAVLSFSASLQSPANPEDNHPSGQQNSVGPLQQSLDNHLMDKYPKESFQGESLCNNMTEKPSQEDQGTVRTIPAETSAANSGHAEHGAFQLDYVHIVDWINGILKVDGEKAFYQFCCINGVVYKLQDHVLIRFNDRLIPSKLQAMWEDVKTKSKWVTVNKCYFPGDLPQAVGRPCGLESSEVYESTIGCTVMAGLIQGPCEVLPPGRFTEEKEKRSTVGKRPNESLRPLYLCKWIYDKPKGLFRDVNC